MKSKGTPAIKKRGAVNGRGSSKPSPATSTPPARLDAAGVQAVEVNDETLARIFGVGRSTIRDWRARGLPKVAPGRYNVLACVRWRLARTTTGSALEADLRRERKALLIEQTRAHALENAEKAAAALPADEVAELMAEVREIYSDALDRLLDPALADTLARSDDLAEIEVRLRAVCRGARVEAGHALLQKAASFADA